MLLIGGSQTSCGSARYAGCLVWCFPSEDGAVRSYNALSWLEMTMSGRDAESHALHWGPVRLCEEYIHFRKRVRMRLGGGTSTVSERAGHSDVQSQSFSQVVFSFSSWPTVRTKTGTITPARKARMAVLRTPAWIDIYTFPRFWCGHFRRWQNLHMRITSRTSCWQEFHECGSLISFDENE